MRSIAGGRSDRYLERRAGRGSERTYASDWNDAAASAALEAIQTEYQKSGSKTLLEYMIHLLSDEERVKDLAYRRCVGITAADRDVVAEVLSHHMCLVQQELADNNKVGAMKKARACLKPLRGRKAARGEVTSLTLPPPPAERVSIRSWLSKKHTLRRLPPYLVHSAKEAVGCSRGWRDGS